MFSENEKISVRQLKRNQWLLLLSMGILLVPFYENEGSVTAGSLAILLLAVFVLWSIWVEAPEENSWLRLPGRIYYWIVGTMIARMTGILIPTLFADRDSPGGDSWMVLSILVLQSL